MKFITYGGKKLKVKNFHQMDDTFGTGEEDDGTLIYINYKTTVHDYNFTSGPGNFSNYLSKYYLSRGTFEAKIGLNYAGIYMLSKELTNTEFKIGITDLVKPGDSIGGKILTYLNPRLYFGKDSKIKPVIKGTLKTIDNFSITGSFKLEDLRVKWLKLSWIDFIKIRELDDLDKNKVPEYGTEKRDYSELETVPPEVDPEDEAINKASNDAINDAINESVSDAAKAAKTFIKEDPVLSESVRDMIRGRGGCAGDP